MARALFCIPASRILVVASAFTAVFAAGCGSNGTTGKNGGTGPVQGETTQVTVLASSTANDQLVKFTMYLQGLTLTNKGGTSVPLVSTTQQLEFMHMNGRAEPLVTVSVPQDVYISASATVGSAGFVCATLQSGSNTTSTYFSNGGTGTVTVQLPQPLTIDGSSMTLGLDLLVSQSATFPSSCYTPYISPFSVTPTFNLTAIDASPIHLTALEGIVQGSGATNGSFTVTGATANPAGGTPGSSSETWQVGTSGNTVFQGVGNAAGLTQGTAVDFDGGLQPDGTVLATRVAVPDPDATNLTVNTGPLMSVAASVPVLTDVNQDSEGTIKYVAGSNEFSFGNATYATWGGLTNMASLPFPASFSSANMVAGQMVAITSHATTFQGGPVYVPAATMTLMPQTINGTVQGVATASGFTTYTVQLAPYNLFPTFAVQDGQTTLLTNPQQVVVYTDSSTQIAPGQGLAVGSLLRFSGVIFNDNGTLRMDCTQVDAGVTE
jgi:hypothetical protein